MAERLSLSAQLAEKEQSILKMKIELDEKLESLRVTEGEKHELYDQVNKMEEKLKVSSWCTVEKFFENYELL